MAGVWIGLVPDFFPQYIAEFCVQEYEKENKENNGRDGDDRRKNDVYNHRSCVFCFGIFSVVIICVISRGFYIDFIFANAMICLMNPLIIYIDEAGRGPLAGPVYVWLVALKKRIVLKGYKDSKKCTPELREQLYQRMINHKSIRWVTAKCNHDFIDEQGISCAIHTSIYRGLEELLKKIVDEEIEGLKQLVKHIGKKNITIMLDGKYDFKLRAMLGVEVRTVIDGDAKVPQIGMASILAKVERDREMMLYHKKYPRYRFDQHKGYGTQVHRDRLAKYGPCKIHRKSYLEKPDNQQSLFS